MPEIINLDDHRPNFVIDADNGVHVVPVALVEDWAAGNVAPNAACVRKIIAEWLGAQRGEE